MSYLHLRIKKSDLHAGKFPVYIDSQYLYYTCKHQKQRESIKMLKLSNIYFLNLPVITNTPICLKFVTSICGAYFFNRYLRITI